MAGGDDRDKTVIGGALPPLPDPRAPAAAGRPPLPSDDPFALRQPPGAAPPMPGAERTVIGGAMAPPSVPMPAPPMPAPPMPGAPPQAASGWGQAAPYPAQAPQPPATPAWGQPAQAPAENTWVGGALPTQPGPGMTPQPAYAPQPHYAPNPYAPPAYPQPGYPSAQPQPYGVPPTPGFGAGLGQGLANPFQPAAGQGFFPDLHQPQAPIQTHAAPRISLRQALQAASLGKGGSSNPLIAAATNLLILFGRLRTGLVEMEAAPLMEHVAREIDGFERTAREAGVPAPEAMVAKYLLCGTADDIVQNLPGADRGIWIQYSMAARFFQTRETGVGFFQEAEKAMQAPAQYHGLLELMLTCLSLGFEGQYRTAPNGAVHLARIRAAIYETLRRVKPRPTEDISVNWLPVLLGGRRRFGSIPVWAVGGIAAALVVAFFGTLSTLINRDGAAAASALYALHPNDVKVALDRAGAIATPFVAPNSQLDRISAALAPEIGQGLVEVGAKGDFIFVRVGNLLLFTSGKADVKPEFANLAARIAEVLNAEPGPVHVWGFTDSQQPSGRGQYKTNLDLSQARAEGVRDVLAKGLTDPARISAEGKGEADPIGPNETEEGRAQNRRVEVMIAKEGTF